MESRRAQILIPLVVLLASAAVYLPSLNYSFVSDDARQISLASPRYEWSYIPTYFTSDIWSFVEQEKSNYYRPVFLIWLLFNYKAFGDEPLGYHATTLAMDLTVVYLLYLLVRRLTRDPVTAGIAALLFGLHPAHTEAVSWVSGVTEPLFAALSLGAILCHLRAREASQPGQRRNWRAASVALFALDLFQKETAIVVPVLLFAEWWLSVDPAAPDETAKDLRERFRTAILGLLPYVYVIVIYMGLRVVALGGFTPHGSIWGWGVTLWTLPSVAWFYLKGLLWPTGFGMFYDVYAVGAPRFMNFFVPLLAILAALALLLWISLRSRVGAFATFLMIMPLLPVLYVRAFSPTDVVHHRYLYVPSAGLAILLALGLRQLTLRSKAAGAITITVIAALLGWSTMRESTPWKDAVSLGARAIEIAPHSLSAESFYGASVYLADRFSEALPHLQASIADPRNTDRSDLLYAAGLCLMRMEAWTSAAADFQQVVELRPSHAHAHLMLGLAEMQQDELGDAETHMREALRLRPRTTVQYQGYHFYLGNLLEKKGDLKGALEEYQAESQENPDMQGLTERIAGLHAQLDGLP